MCFQWNLRSACALATSVNILSFPLKKFDFSFPQKDPWRLWYSLCNCGVWAKSLQDIHIKCVVAHAVMKFPYFLLKLTSLFLSELNLCFNGNQFLLTSTKEINHISFIYFLIQSPRTKLPKILQKKCESKHISTNQRSKSINFRISQAFSINILDKSKYSNLRILGVEIPSVFKPESAITQFHIYPKNQTYPNTEGIRLTDSHKQANCHSS